MANENTNPPYPPFLKGGFYLLILGRPNGMCEGKLWGGNRWIPDTGCRE